jgi:hypothetical protein
MLWLCLANFIISNPYQISEDPLNTSASLLMVTSAISTTLLCLRMLVLSALILIGHYITILNPKGKKDNIIKDSFGKKT